MTPTDTPVSLKQGYVSHPVTDLQKDEFLALWYRLHVFVYDLRNFNSGATARGRLDTATDPVYLGKPYFSEEEVWLLRSTEVGPNEETLDQRVENTLEERLNRRMKRRVQSGDFRVCAAHDLAPMFEKVFHVNPKKLAKDVKFMSLMTANGLTFRDDETASILGRPFENELSENKKKKMQKKKKGR